MKKSNKTSIWYILSSIALFIFLSIGGGYGIYLSVGLNFIKSSVSNVASTGASNVAFGGSVNFQSSMFGVIILSIVLIVLSIFDFASLIKQIVLFKQFKAVKNSSIEKSIENKVKSKGSVIFFAGLIDVVSFIAGIAGIFINSRCFVGNNVSWILYFIDGFVSLFALVSFILLISKIRSKTKNKVDDNSQDKPEFEPRYYEKDYEYSSRSTNNNIINIDKIEYDLLKLKYLKSNKFLSVDEYENIRKSLLPKSQKSKSNDTDNQNEN